jgi:hypothetical protein
VGIIKKVVSGIKTVISKRKQTSSQTEIPATQLGGIKVTDFQSEDGKSGGSVTTTTSPSGEVTSRKVSVTGRSSTPQLQQQMISATEQLEKSQTEKSKLSASSDTSFDTTTEAGKKLNRELGALSTENTKYENKIQTQTTSFSNSRFDYYQDLVNRRKLTVDEANARYKKDVENYQNALVEDENKRRKSAYQNVIDANAVTYIGEFQGIVDQTSFTPEKTTRWQKVKDVAKAVYVSTPFGTSTKFREDIAKDVQQERYDFTLKSLLGQGVPTFVPLKTSLEAVRKERSSQYSAEQQVKLFEQFNKAVENAPLPIKYQVQDRGLTYLAQKGMRFDEISNASEVSLMGKDFDRRVSQNILEWEKARGSKGKLDEVLVGSRIVSTKALEFYGLSKAIGSVVGAGSKLYKSTKFAKALSSFGDPTIKKIGSTTFKITTIGAVTGVYGIGLSQKYKKYKEISEYGKGVFLLETGGELAGIGLTITEGALARRSANRIARTENALIEQRKQGLQNLKLGQYSDKSVVGYREKGINVKLNLQQQTALAREYAKIEGISQKEAMQIIRGKSFYRSTVAINSDASSYERALKTFRTGKGTVGDPLYRINRYGFVDTFKTPSGETQQFALEFSKKGGYVSNVQLKTVVGKDNVAITNIFEKARASKRYDDVRWILKENILSKATPKNKLYLIESKLNKLYPYKREVLKLDEVLEIGTKRSPLNEFDRLWGRTDFAKSSIFVGGKAEIPASLDTNIGKITLEDVTVFKQVALGKRSFVLKNLLKNMELTDTKLVRGEFVKTPLSKTFGSTSTSQGFGSAQSQASVSKALKDEIIGKITQQEISKQILTSPQLSSFNIMGRSSAVNELSLSSLLKGQELALIKGLSFEKANVKTAVKEKMSSLTNVSLKQEISLRSIQQSAQKSGSSQSYLGAFDFKFDNFGVFSPVLSTPRTRTPKIFKPLDLEKDLMKQIKLKKELKKRKITELGLLPDFTARIVGLSSPKISIKDIEKQIMKIQTGAEIRTGAKLIWQ